MNTNKIQSIEDLSKEQLIQLLVMQTQTSNSILNGIEKSYTNNKDVYSHLAHLYHFSDEITLMDDISCIVIDKDFERLNTVLKDSTASEIKVPNTDIVIDMDTMQVMIGCIIKIKAIKLLFDELNNLWQHLENDDLSEILDFQYPFTDDFNELCHLFSRWSISTSELTEKAFRYSFYTSKSTPSHP